MEQIIPSIEGASQFIEYVGEWPSFHDAEIIELFLSRQSTSWIKLYCPPPVSKGRPDDNRYNITVTFKMTGVLDINLSEFNHQNVIFDLQVQPIPEGYHIELSPCFGLNGFIKTSKLSVEFEKGS